MLYDFSKHHVQERVCAKRLPFFEMSFLKQTIGETSFVDPVPSESSSIESPQGERRGPIPEGASNNGSNQGAGALYDVTTSNYPAVPTG